MAYENIKSGRKTKQWTKRIQHVHTSHERKQNQAKSKKKESKQPNSTKRMSANN